jgi:hypothetical protein
MVVLVEVAAFRQMVAPGIRLQFLLVKETMAAILV